MGLFRKKDRVVDFSERYGRMGEQFSQKIKQIDEAKTKESSGAGFGFLSDLASSATPTDSSDFEVSGNANEKRKKLAKRLIDMTARIEDMSNQIYHLQQRIDLLEKKLKISKGE